MAVLKLSTVTPESIPPSLHPEQLPCLEIPGLYIHIPFCFHKCHYCDFYSITRQTEGRMERFVELMLAEADLWSAGRSGPTPRPATVFFGGGTPSLLPLEPMRRLIRGLHDRFDLSQVDEWTVEVNPATTRDDYLAMLRENGVNRLSFGAQSFNPAELKALERHHNPDDVGTSLHAARGAGFDRLNLDLIYAIPGQDIQSWTNNLNMALALGTTHLSCYGLTYEPNTPMAVRKRLGHFSGVPESVELEMMHLTQRRLTEAGLPPYEISNYAAAGEECRHNLLYWSGGNYIGLGPSAASHVEGWRWRNRPHLGEWEAAAAAGVLPAFEVETLTPTHRQAELAMLNLRLTRGLNFADFAARTGCDARNVFADVIDRLCKIGLLSIGIDSLRLTRAGIDVADAVASEFLAG